MGGVIPEESGWVKGGNCDLGLWIGCWQAVWVLFGKAGGAKFCRGMLNAGINGVAGCLLALEVTAAARDIR